MKVALTIDQIRIRRISRIFSGSFPWNYVLFGLAITLSISVIAISSVNDLILTYSDAESHINIAKRVLSSSTPGFAQLGGIWLPLPHIMMLPFIWSDYLWRTGLGGAIVSSVSYIISSIFLYRLMQLVMRDKGVAFFGTIVFVSNVNILFMQSTAMSELPLILFFILSMYYFIRYAMSDSSTHLLTAGVFGFLATLSRYDGWFLVGVEALLIVAKYYRSRVKWKQLQGKFIMFVTIAFFGIALWLLWGYTILGDPLYFTNSQFSAKSQQDIIRENGALYTYHNLPLSMMYYSFAAMTNAGMLLFGTAVIGFYRFLRTSAIPAKQEITVLFLVPFMFYVLTLFAGQSVLYLPHINSGSMFNVRYGLMAMPFVAFFSGYLFYRSAVVGKTIIAGLFVLQLLLYGIGYAPVITFNDGTSGASYYRNTESEIWLKNNYDRGYILMDDYARSISLVHTNIPMDRFIYLGNKDKYEAAIRNPERVVSWIILRYGDMVWKDIYHTKDQQDKLNDNFDLVHDTDNIKIFRVKNVAK